MLDRIDSYRWLIVAILAVPVLTGAVLLWSEQDASPGEPLTIEEGGDIPSDLRVYITGAVVQPGVYSLPPGLRWIDALEAAGGPTTDADLSAINLATRAEDEDMIVVPRLGVAITGGQASTTAGVVNINTATEAELDSLPGIGEVRAGRILASRQEEGPFSSTDDLLTRELVPESVFEDIAQLITVN